LVRPELIELIFKRGQRRGRPAAGQYKTRVITSGTEVLLPSSVRPNQISTMFIQDA